MSRATVLSVLGSTLLTCGAVAGGAGDGPTPAVLPVWPGAAPGETGQVGGEVVKTKAGTETVASITNVSEPTLTVYRPDAAGNAGVAVLVCPGGGYNNLAWDHEGTQVARWLNGLGVTAAVLKYRVPRREGTPRDRPPPQALADAQRALRLVRENAAGWGVDPNRVGVLGFSAGGHLAAWASTNFDRPSYPSKDAADALSPRPDFAVMVYPGGVMKRDGAGLSDEIRVSPETPPTFLAHSGDDRVSAENSVLYYLALRRAGVPAELHVYATGGHGYGLRPGEKPHASWPARCEAWLRDSGVLPAGPAAP